jgi:hypothetical protein
MGYLQRFTKAGLMASLEKHGFVVESTRELNKIGRLAWGIFGGLFGSDKINKLSLKLFDKSVWLTRLLDAVLPWSGLNLIVIARKK